MAIKFESPEHLRKLPVSYLLDVKKNMQSGGTNTKLTTIRFGETGSGCRPNYEIKFSNGNSVAYNSSNHQHDSKVKVFKAKNVSREFSLLEIIDAINLAVFSVD